MTDHEARARELAERIAVVAVSERHNQGMLHHVIAAIQPMIAREFARDASYAAGVEDAAKVVRERQIVDTVDGQILERRMDGNNAGLAYVVGIRALIPAKED